MTATEPDPLYPPPGSVGRFHPDTSVDAAYQSAWVNMDHCERILVRALLNGERGITSDEMAHELGLSVPRVGSRLVDLRADGCQTGLRPQLMVRLNVSRAMPGGNPCKVHVLNDAGRKVAERLARELGIIDDDGQLRGVPIGR